MTIQEKQSASEAATTEARAMRTKHETALAAVSTAESAFESTPNDSAWKRVTEARANADRADLVARHHERKAGEAVAALAAAERIRDLAALEDIIGRVSDDGYRARVATTLERYTAAYDEMHAARTALLADHAAHDALCSDGRALAAKVGIESKKYGVRGTVFVREGRDLLELNDAPPEKLNTLMSRATFDRLAARGVDPSVMGLAVPAPMPAPIPRVRRAVVQTETETTAAPFTAEGN